MGNEHLVFVWRTSGYELREREGDIPAVGDEVHEDGVALRVMRLGRRWPVAS